MAIELLSDRSTRIRWGLILVSVLLAARFVLVPLLQWQQERVDRIAMLERYQLRSDIPASKTDELESRHQAYQQAVEQLRQRYPVHDDPRDLQLQTQQTMERLAGEQQLRIERSDWGVAAEGAVMEAPLRLRLSGRLDRLYSLLNELESTEQAYRITNLSLEPQRGDPHQFDAEVHLRAWALNPEYEQEGRQP